MDKKEQKIVCTVPFFFEKTALSDSIIKFLQHCKTFGWLPYASKAKFDFKSCLQCLSMHKVSFQIK